MVSHARALLDSERTVAIQGDFTRPGEILGSPDVRAVLDFSKPVLAGSGPGMRWPRSSTA